MSQIGLLQSQLSELKKVELELQQEKRGLLGFQQESTNASQQTQWQITKKYNYINEFQGLKPRTTLADKLALRVEKSYGLEKKRKVLLNYEGIADEIESALYQIKVQLEICQQQIGVLERNIKSLQEEENKKAATKEN